MMREVAHARKRTPHPIWLKFCRVVDIPDVITYANVGEDRLRGLGVEGSKFALFHWLWSSPLNTLALPCECDRPKNSLHIRGAKSKQPLNVIVAP